MVTMTAVYSNLRTRFPNWADLKAFLTSQEGGSLRVVDPTPGQPFAVIRSVKGQDTSCPHAKDFRSVVWDTERNLPVCVAPRKAEEGGPPTGIPLSVSECFDGCMVNAFVSGGVLHLATRTCIGADNTFYGGKTFAQMFDEALGKSTWKTREGVAATLGEGGFASFVVQHPAHRVVAKFSRPTLQLIHTGTVDSALGLVAIHYSVEGMVQKTYGAEKEVADLMERMQTQMGWRWQGLCFVAEDGRRWRIRSHTYSMMRELRGGEAKDVDRFLRLRAEHKVSEYLKHFSDDRTIFWGLEQRLRAATRGILDAYADCHMAHAVAFKDLPAAVKPAVYMLHVKWLNTLREGGHRIRLEHAIEVVAALRLFEQRRLVEADAYVRCVAIQRAPTQPAAAAAEHTEEGAAAGAAAGASV